jgi:hypothetical protein
MINWGALGLVGIVSLAAAVAVVVLVSFAIVGLSAREHSLAGTIGTGSVSPTVGTAIAGLCLLAVVAIVGYGLYVIVA